ncbi:cyclin-like protein [Gonapodya prolifera JEL478]|uniref:Cyclin-like protein n=1 Tax=Gonapodya prolifera (strain JEL478) TaxID=1344416 RepID=A0A139ASA2_GONPJ|nr:cyclin-like protein [Gonapodya prolifera JEL478]|eukprot:KXS19636.1 cyclin-like protein [Gonapodya prolifera JEL478]
MYAIAERALPSFCSMEPELGDAQRWAVHHTQNQRLSPHMVVGGPSTWMSEETAAYIDTLIEREALRLPVANHMSYQPQLSEQMRYKLIQWLLDVAKEFRLHRQSSALAVNVLDRYLSRRRVPRGDLQLLGIVSLYVACKYEEIPSQNLTIPMMHRLCCAHYAVDDFGEMERRILTVLDFDLEFKGAGELLDCITEEPSPSDIPLLLRRDSGVNVGGADVGAPDQAMESLLQAPSQPRLDIPTNISPPSATLCAHLIGPVSTPVATVAHRLVELSLLDSRFSCLRTSVVAFAAVLAADALFQQSGIMDELSTQRYCTILYFDPTISDVAQALVRAGNAFGLPATAFQ